MGLSMKKMVHVLMTSILTGWKPGELKFYWKYSGNLRKGHALYRLVDFLQKHETPTSIEMPDYFKACLKPPV